MPDALAVVLFIAIGFLYFFQPVTEGLVLTGHDHSGGIGAGVEMQEYQKRTGERTRWTNALFSGMPTYQMAPSYDSIDTLVGLQKIYQLGMTGVVMFVFVMLLGFYILLRAFDFKVWMAALGAVLWAFSSYFFIIIGAGHIWKVMALAYIPPTIAGLVLCYRGVGWGSNGFLPGFANHVQPCADELLLLAGNGIDGFGLSDSGCEGKEIGRLVQGYRNVDCGRSHRSDHQFVQSLSYLPI